MRISDWSSDVCSSDLTIQGLAPALLHAGEGIRGEVPHLRHARFHIQAGAARLIREDDGGEAFEARLAAVVAAAGAAQDQALRRQDFPDHQSEKRRVGEQWVSTCKSRGST